MGSNSAQIIAALILIVFAGATYYYWNGGEKYELAITGRVIKKFQRELATKLESKPLQKGLRALSGKFSGQNVFYFLLLRRGDGKEVEIEVSQDFFSEVIEGDTIQQVTSDAMPVIVKFAPSE